MTLLPGDFLRWLKECGYATGSPSKGDFKLNHPEGMSGALCEFELFGDVFVRLNFNVCKALVVRENTLPVVWRPSINVT